MQIDIRNITDEGLLLTFNKDFEFFPTLKELVEKDEYKFLTPIEIEINASYSIDKKIRIIGKSSVNVEIACDRCLTKYTHPVSAEFNLVFSDKAPKTPEEENHNEDGFEIPRDAEDIEYYTGDIIQLTNCIQEQVVLALPHGALCNDNCKGLCQKCGGNLNNNKCDCEKDVGHPAFAALKNLKTQK